MKPEEKREGWWEGFTEKEGIKPRMKEYVGDGIPIRIGMTVGTQVQESSAY